MLRPVGSGAATEVVGAVRRLHNSIVVPRVLVVEDDPDNRDALATVLRDNAFDVECARDGAEGLRVARAWGPDLVLLDVVMPVMNGFEFLERTASDSRLARTPVVVMTGFSSDGAMMRSGRVPRGVPVLSKPFEEAELLAAIEGALATCAS